MLRRVVVCVVTLVLVVSSLAGVDVEEPTRRTMRGVIENAGVTVADVNIDWTSPIMDLATSPSLQVVAHALLMRDSPMHDQVFGLLRDLSPHYLRYVPWMPTPRLGVAELNPPSGPHLCSGEPAEEASTVVLDCGEDGGTIQAIEQAFYGNPTGHCGSYTPGSCNAQGTLSAVERACVGKTSCHVQVSGDAFGMPKCDPPVSVQSLVIQARCSNPAKQHTYWDFKLLDEQFLDVWNAIDGDNVPVIPNFSTAPTWLYDNSSWGYNHECTAANTCKFGGYNHGSAPASANGGSRALGEYYGRLLSWYTKGGFTDEYGAFHKSGHSLNISMWEIFNEVDYEHSYTPESYVTDYDAIVRGIRAAVDPEKKIKFVGMSLPNIDDTNKVVEWTTYFLNSTNHHEDVRDSLDYIGYHSYPTSAYKPFDSDASYSKFFDYADEFVSKVKAVEEVRKRLSPSTKVCLDESGTDDGLKSLDDPMYFVASASHWAYLFARCAAIGDSIVVVGQSQFMDSPDREPSVTMLNWESGKGTARYWVTKLLINSFALGDQFVQTTVTNPQVFAQGYIHDPHGKNIKRMLLINKTVDTTQVHISVGSGSCSAAVVDTKSNEGPARTIHCDANGVLTLTSYATAIVNLN